MIRKVNTELGKDYYNLKELIQLTNLKYSQLKRRMKIIKVKYEKSGLIIFSGGRYFIHKSIIPKFKRERKIIDYKLFVTISPEGSYNKLYLREFVNYIYSLILEKNPLERLRWVPETSSNGYYHIHILTTYTGQRNIREIIKTHHLGVTNLDLNFKKIKDEIDLKNKLNYIRKENRSELLKPLKSKKALFNLLF